MCTALYSGRALPASDPFPLSLAQQQPKVNGLEKLGGAQVFRMMTVDSGESSTATARRWVGARRSVFLRPWIGCVMLRGRSAIAVCSVQVSGSLPWTALVIPLVCPGQTPVNEKTLANNVPHGAVPAPLFPYVPFQPPCEGPWDASLHRQLMGRLSGAEALL